MLERRTERHRVRDLRLVYRARAIGAVACALLALFISDAGANGRPPGTISIEARAGHPDDVVIGTTFGVVITHDGGGTWRWLCEAGLGYGGPFDPHLVWFGSGTIVVTALKGLQVSSDGCTWRTPTELGGRFASVIARAGEHALFAAVSDADDAHLYRSADEGQTFTQVSSPGPENTYWESIAVAPSDPDRVYLAGWVITPERTKDVVLVASRDGGKTFAPMASASLAPRSPQSAITVVAIAPTDPDQLYVRVTNQAGKPGDAIYRSGDAGAHFVKVLALADSITGLVVRHNGDVLAQAPQLGLYRSKDHGRSFSRFTTSPALHGHCLIETSDDALWSCTENFGAERMGAARSPDGTTWSRTLRYEELAGPVACPAGTKQASCATHDWCAVRTQLGVSGDDARCTTASTTADPGPSIAVPATPPTPGSAAAPQAHATRRGCCDAGGGDVSIALAMMTWLGLRRRRGPRLNSRCRTETRRRR